MKKSIKKITQFVLTFVALLILVLGRKGMEVSAATQATATRPFTKTLVPSDALGGEENGFPELEASPSSFNLYIKIDTPSDGWIKINNDAAVGSSFSSMTNYSKNSIILVEANKSYCIKCGVNSQGGRKSGLCINYHEHNFCLSPTRIKIGDRNVHKLQKKCICGQPSYETEAHTWTTSETVAPTCTEKGYTISTCEGCKEQKKDYDTNKIPHNYSSYAQLNSSQHKIKCSRCSDYIVENHSFVRSGSNNVCSKCGYSYDASSVSSSDDSFNSAAPPKKFYVTKFDSKKVNITIVPSSLNYLDETVDYEVYANGKKVKTFSNYRGYDAIIFTYKAKGAAKKKYQVKVVQKADNSVAVSATLKPKTNKPKKVKYSFTKRASAYSVMANTWRPSSITKKGNKITVKGFFVNNHILKLSSIKCRIMVQYVDIDSRRTKIKSKVINSGSIRAHSIKNTSFSFSTKKLMDFQNEGRLHVDYFITGWRY